MLIFVVVTANLVRLGSVESVISVNRASEHPECKHLLFFISLFHLSLHFIENCQ